MSVGQISPVREVLLESASFGPSEVAQIEDAIVHDQAAEVRYALRELDSRIRSSSRPSKRDLTAAGVTAYLLGQHDLAEEYLSQVSGDGLAEFYRGQVLMALERYAEAAESFDKAARDGYDRVECTLHRAGAIRLTGDVDTAEEMLRKIVREAATRAEYSYQMGCVLADRGDTFGAIEYFERAADMDPHHSGALFRLANENNLLGNDDEAIQLYERSLSRPPLYLGALINLGLLYEDKERYAAAAFCFRRVLEAYPNHQRALLYLKDIEASGDMYYDEEAERRRRELDQVLRIPLSDFELSARARNCLEKAGIRTLGDLTRITEQELLQEKNFGETSLKEINEIMEQRGLRIGQAVERAKPLIPVYHAEELSPQERALLDKPVSELGLSVRSRKCLSRLGIVTLGELVSRTPDELMSVRNFGVTSLNEIRAKLAEYDLKLRND